MNLKHPILSRNNLTVFYILFWIFISSAYVALQTMANGMDLESSIFDSISIFVFFAIIGLPIWYIIRYSGIDNFGIGRTIMTHLVAATIIVFIWMYLGAIFLKLTNPDIDFWQRHNFLYRLFTGYILYLIYVLYFYTINYYQGFKEKLRNEGKLKSLVKEAELHALKSQINPHFLFNSLNSISSLTMIDPKRAQTMVINLSQLMRYSLQHQRDETVALKTELDNNKLYMQIEKVRFGDKLNPIFEVDEQCLQKKIPNMLLQPLYENAIKYGVYEALEPVDIITKCWCDDDLLEIEIANSYDNDSYHHKGEGIGLNNIRDRLQIVYGNSKLMTISNVDNIFTVNLSIPQSIKYLP